MKRYLTIWAVVSCIIMGFVTAGITFLAFAMWEIPPFSLSEILMVVRWVVGFSAMFSFFIWLTYD